MGGLIYVVRHGVCYSKHALRADAPIPCMFSSSLALYRYFTYARLIRTLSFHYDYHLLYHPLFDPRHCSTSIQYLVPLFQLRLAFIH